MPQWICGMMPVHEVFAEPFAGSAAIARHKPPAHRTILVDRSSSAPSMMDPVAADITIGGDDGRVEQIVGCGIKWLVSILKEANKRWLVYLDPPYPRGSRSSSKRMYEYEMTDKQHGQLLDVAKRLKCHVMISSYDNPLYARRLRRWSLETRWAMTRSGMREEHCWMNFEPSQVAKFPTLDRAPNFRERERVKKKARRWVRMLQECPDYEREFIFDQLGRNWS